MYISILKCGPGLLFIGLSWPSVQFEFDMPDLEIKLHINQTSPIHDLSTHVEKVYGTSRESVRADMNRATRRKNFHH
jgi:hypothetical protein